MHEAALLEIRAGRMLLKDYQKEQFGLQLFSRTYQSFANSQYRMGLQRTGTIVMGFALGLFVDIVILGVELLFVRLQIYLHRAICCVCNAERPVLPAFCSGIAGPVRSGITESGCS